MLIKCFPVNFIEENCYIVSSRQTREAIIIDCGARSNEECEAIADYIRQERLHPLHHLLTHAHFDHIFGAEWVADTYGLHPEMHQDDLATYAAQPAQMAAFLHRALPLTLPASGPAFSDGATFRLGGFTVKAIHTPGHTPGGCCFYLAEQHLLFSGDTLFLGSRGRTDFPGGSESALLLSIRERLLSLPADTDVLPGHGPATTIAGEALYY